jgi:undecaprenyl-diphosphatase
MTHYKPFIYFIIEGLTEYLPVSSTAFMVLSSYFGIQEDDFVKLFQVSIQFGAILAVVALWKKFFDFSTKNVAITLHQTDLCCHSCSRFGKLFDDKIEAVLAILFYCDSINLGRNCFVIY